MKPGAMRRGKLVYFQPIRQDLGVSYTAMSLVFSLARADGGTAGPLVGWLVDRFGARRMVFLGGLMAGLGLMESLAVSGTGSCPPARRTRR